MRFCRKKTANRLSSLFLCVEDRSRDKGLKEFSHNVQVILFLQQQRLSRLPIYVIFHVGKGDGSIHGFQHALFLKRRFHFRAVSVFQRGS
jgi:hypothetical protein